MLTYENIDLFLDTSTLLHKTLISICPSFYVTNFGSQETSVIKEKLDLLGTQWGKNKVEK